MMAAANEALTALGDDLSDVQYGFHWPPFHSVAHLHMHAISPASQMGFVSRMIFRPNSYWFVSVSILTFSFLTKLLLVCFCMYTLTNLTLIVIFYKDKQMFKTSFYA